MFEDTHEFIDLIERFKWNENVNEDDEAWARDYTNLEQTMREFIHRHARLPARHVVFRSHVLDGLPVVLLHREASYLTFEAVERFCNEYYCPMYTEGCYFRKSKSLEAEIKKTKQSITTLQRWIKCALPGYRQALPKGFPLTKKPCPTCKGPTCKNNKHRANELIELIEGYEWDEDVYKYEEIWTEDYQNVDRIITRFLRIHGIDKYGDSDILLALPALVYTRTIISRAAYESFEIFWDDYDTIAHPYGYFGNTFEEEMTKLDCQVNKLQRCIKRFLSTKETCAICLGPTCNKPIRCGHVFHPDCIGKWKQVKTTCPMCRKPLE